MTNSKCGQVAIVHHPVSPGHVLGRSVCCDENVPASDAFHEGSTICRLHHHIEKFARAILSRLDLLTASQLLTHSRRDSFVFKYRRVILSLTI